MSKEEPINPDAMNIALLREIQKHMISMNEDIQAVRKDQERNTVHLKYEVDLSVARTNEEIADFPKMGLDINSIMILPIPSALSIRLRGLTDEVINLSEKQSLSLNNHKITRLLVTNVTGSGTAEIHVFGKPEV
jgi:hypothetical protein